MAKRKGRHRKQGGRTTPPGTQPAGRPRTPSIPPGGEPEMVRTIRKTIEAGLVATLETASTFTELGTARPLDSFPGFDGTQRERTDLGELLDTFIESGFPAMRVLATAMLPLLSDEVLARRVRRRLEEVRIPLAPRWLDHLEQPEIVATKIMTDPLGDGDNLMIAASWRGRHAAVAVIYVDHNMGTLVKDGFIVPDTLEATLATYAKVDEGALDRISDIDPADARARITEALEQSDRTIPPIETETWPAIRPLIEWWLSLLPEGGHGYENREWSDEELDELVERFVTSSFATETGLPADEIRRLADPMVWFAAGPTPGDPLRWSPVSVEIALTDFLPRKVRAPREQLERVPPVMAALVRFAHHERGDDPVDTEITLEAIEHWTPDFLDALAEPRPSPASNAARLARLAAGLDPDDIDDIDVDFDEDEDDDDELDLDDLLGLLDTTERWLIGSIGGPEAVDRLDDEPLPDVAFDWSRVPDDRRPLVEDVLARVDAVCDSHLDLELRTIARTYLAEVVAADAKLFERSTRTDLIAAGLVWATISIQRSGTGAALLPLTPTQKELAAAMDVNPSSMAQRASSIGATLQHQTDIVHSGPWHSERRRYWLGELASISQFRTELRNEGHT